MNKFKLSLISIMLIITIAVGIAAPAQKVYAAGVTSKSVVVTLNNKKSYQSFRIKLNKNVMAVASVKILKVTGKAKDQTDNGGIYWGYYGCVDAKGSLFYNLKPKDFKKGTVLTSEDGIKKKGGVTFDLPEGIKKLKIKITFKTQDNSKSLTTVKKTDDVF